MESFFNTNATAIFTLISSILTLSVSYFFKLKSQDKKNVQDLKIKELEQRQKISQDTYQKLFEKKIEVYNTLHTKLYSHKRNILNIGREIEENDDFGKITFTTIKKEDVYIDFIKEICEFLEKDIFYISKELETNFVNISLPFESKNLMTSDIWMFYNMDDDDLEKEFAKVDKKFYLQYEKDVSSLIKLLEDEIKLIKKNIDFN